MTRSFTPTLTGVLLLALLLVVVPRRVQSFSATPRRPPASYTTRLDALSQPTPVAPRATESTPTSENSRLSMDDDDASTDGDPSPHNELARWVAQLKDTAPGLLDEDTTILMGQRRQELLENMDEDPLVTLPLATDLLVRLVQEYQETADSDSPLLPTADFDQLYQAWLTALTTLTKVDSKSKGKRASNPLLSVATSSVQDLWHIQRQWARQQGPSAQATTETYELLLDVLSQSRFDSKQVWHLFQDLDEDRVTKTPRMYAAVIQSTAQSRHKHAASRAEQILQEAPSVTVESCNRVLTAWAKSGLSYGPERAENLIRWMDSEAQIAPNVGSFTSLMDAHAQQVSSYERGKSWEAAVTCEGILQSLVDLYLEDRNPSLEPTAATWTIPMGAWTRLAKKNRRPADERAAQVFTQWETLYQQGKVKQGPDGLAYQMVLQAFTRGDPARAEAWLDRQYEAYQTSKDEALRPTARSVRNVVEAWTRHQEAPAAMEEAEFVWERYQDVVEADPEVITDVYRTLLFGFCQRQQVDRAYAILEEMVERQLAPDCVCFDRILEANTQSDGPVARAYQVFRLLEAQRLAGHVQPNERVYNSFIRALTRAKIPNLATKAQFLLQRMYELETNNPEIRPTTFSYNAVLLAAAESPADPTNEAAFKVAFKVAVETFNELRQDEREDLDHVSFGNMLRCANLLPQDDPKREALIRSIFTLCCRLGWVNAFVIRDLQTVAEPAVWGDLLGVDDASDQVVAVEDLPSTWSYQTQKPKRKART
jgi:pentatricopeptide repeat protein